MNEIISVHLVNFYSVKSHKVDVVIVVVVFLFLFSLIMWLLIPETKIGWVAAEMLLALSFFGGGDGVIFVSKPA